jgi:hypothetical protein
VNNKDDEDKKPKNETPTSIGKKKDANLYTSNNPQYDSYPQRIYCGGDGKCHKNIDNVKCQYSKSSLADCDKAFPAGTYVHDGYTADTCYFGEEIRVCKKKDANIDEYSPQTV